MVEIRKGKSLIEIQLMRDLKKFVLEAERRLIWAVAIDSAGGKAIAKWDGESQAFIAFLYQYSLRRFSRTICLIPMTKGWYFKLEMLGAN